MTNKQPLYQAPWWLKSGHLQTIWTQTLNIKKPPYQRKLLPASCGETQVAYDFIYGSKPDAPVVILFHGLEGSSDSHYAKLLMHQVQQCGFNGVVPHYRGCGSVPNTSHISYHSGDSTEVAWMLKTIRAHFPNSPLFAMGVSLGGNVLAKYLGETQQQALLQAAAIVSAPLNLTAAAQALNHGLSKQFYAPYFLKTLLPKAKEQKPYITNTDIQWQTLQDAKSLLDFDNAFTAPLNNFKDAQDYYQQCSAKPLLKKISKPTLIINAKNDPFMPATALPTKQDVSSYITLMQPDEGGHVGFIHGKFPGQANWLPQTVINYFSQHL